MKWFFNNIPPSIGDMEVSTNADTDGILSHASFYLYNAHMLVTPTLALTAGMFCWRHRRKMLQQQAHQQALATFVETLGQWLPIPNWQFTVSSDHAGFTITYTLQLEEYVSIQEGSDSLSVGKAIFKQCFTQAYLGHNIQFPLCSISKHDRNGSFELRLHIAKPVEEFFEQDKPLPGNALNNGMQRAQTKFLTHIKPHAAESKIAKLLLQKDELLTDSKADDDEFETLLNPWFGNPAQWQETINFIEKKVLANHEHLLSTTGIANHLSQLRTAKFNQLSFREKLAALLWLHRQLDTIAQVINNPQNITVDPPGDHETAVFYRPFAGIVQKQANNKRKDAQNFQHQASSFIEEKHSITDRPEADFKIETVITQLTDWVQQKSQKKREFATEWAQKFHTTKTLDAQEKHKHAANLDEFIFDIRSNRILNDLPHKMERFFNLLTGKGTYFWEHNIKISRSNQETIRGKCLETMVIMTAQKAKTKEEQQETIGDFFTQSAWLVEESEKEASASCDIQQINLALLKYLRKIIFCLQTLYPNQQGPLEQINSFAHGLSLKTQYTSNQIFELMRHLTQEMNRTTNSCRSDSVPDFSAANNEERNQQLTSYRKQ